MKFKVTTASIWYKDNKHLEELRKLGFEFIPSTWKDDFEKKDKKQWADIEINTLEELLDLQSKVGDIVVCPNQEIIIYDGYLE